MKMKNPTFKEPDVDLSFKSKPLTALEEKQLSAIIAKDKADRKKHEKTILAYA
jgi:hypothetical protein